MKDITLKDYEEIMEAVNCYVEGGKKNSESMKPGFHKNATINGEPIQTLFDLVDKLGETDAKARVDILDVVNNIACVRITIEGWHNMNFVDFHLLMKGEDGWKIVSKIYTEV